MQHQSDKGQVDEGLGRLRKTLVILGESAVAAGPGDGTLDDPTFRQSDKALLSRLLTDNLNVNGIVGLDHYVEDVKHVADGLPSPPVLIGHSMGGAVVQKYLEQHAAPGAVLLASVPAAGTLRATLRYARRHPIQFLKGNLTLSLYPFVGSPALTRSLFFSESMPAELVQAYFSLEFLPPALVSVPLDNFESALA